MRVGPHVYRGFDLRRALMMASRIALIYGGAILVLWTLGWVIRGAQGWTLVLAPPAVIVALRLWAWRRVSVEIADGSLRFEGASTRDDFEVSLDSIQAVYFHRLLPGRPLVIALDDGDERVFDKLRLSRADELHAHLVRCGARDRQVLEDP